MEGGRKKGEDAAGREAENERGGDGGVRAWAWQQQACGFAALLVPSQQQSRGAGCSAPPGAQPAAEQGRGLQHPSWCPASASSQASKEKARKDWQREQAGTPQLQLTGSDKR